MSSSSAAGRRTCPRGWLGWAPARSPSTSHRPSSRPLRAARNTSGLTFPLVEASAEDVPLPDDSFDLVVSEYGASVWCDPERWIAEAARLLRPGGRLVFLTNSVLVSLCVPEQSGYAGESLRRPQPDVRRVRWPEGGVEFHPSHGDWVRVLRTNGFVVEALHELYAPDDAETHRYYEIVTAEWARQWPVEDLWVASLAAATAIGRDYRRPLRSVPDLRPSGSARTWWPGVSRSSRAPAR